MSVCSLCNLEMREKVSCVSTSVLTNSGVCVPIRYGEERRFPMKSANCGDCGAPRGGFHHRGCDLERCPRCSGQLISCGCDETELRPEDLEVGPDEEADYLDYITNYAANGSFVARQLNVNDGDFCEEQAEEENRCVDLYLHPDQALYLLHNALNLTEEPAERSRIVRMIHGDMAGDVIRVCFFRASPREFYPSIPSTSAYSRWRAPFDPVQSRLDQLAAKVGGHGALLELDAVPVTEEVFDWNGFPDEIVAMLASVIDELIRVCALAWPGSVGLELQFACQRFLGNLASSDAGIVRKIENPAKLAGAICWLVGRANNCVRSRGQITATALAKMFGLPSSPSDLGGRLKRVLVNHEWADPYNDTSLKSARYLISSVRETIETERDALMVKRALDAKTC
jgi:hypothetical protein